MTILSTFSLIMLCLLTGFSSLAQRINLSNTNAEILREGLALYQSERASWEATDLFMARNPAPDSFNDYLTYTVADSVRTVFVRTESATSTPSVVSSYTFPAADIRSASAHFAGNRAATASETQWWKALQAVRAEMQTHQRLGNSYTVPASCNLNVVLLTAAAGGWRAYLLPGSKEAGLLPIGNDYLLTLDAGGEVKKAERLHNSFIPMRRPEADTITMEGTVHTHLPAHPFITPTDICSLLLYEGLGLGKQHLIIGPAYVSVFETGTDSPQLNIIPRKTFEKIQRSQKK